MPMDTLSSDVRVTFSADERHALLALRSHYRLNRDLFSANELARLRFLRWLYQTSHLEP